ncbi:MAG TPA: hypothetical protein VN672_05110 [Solirubrobacteraceae bacterium]|nr:hypothetical protein [Solirubrobacteraceae bacterium]
MERNDEPVRIAAYDPASPARFEQEKALLQPASNARCDPFRPFRSGG